METVESALRLVLEHARPLPPRRLPLADALGRTLAEDVAADLDQPPFDKALVDGYAVAAQELGSDPPHRLRVGEEITAGRTPSRPLAPGEAAFVMTGAPLPRGADAVAMLEEAERHADGSVSLLRPIRAGQNRLTRGREMRAGEVVLNAGVALTPARLGVLAAVGRTELAVLAPPRLAILPTGDELVEPGQVPGPGQIRETNSTVLAALARRYGAVESPKIAPVARDEDAALREAIEGALRGADVLLISGGVSAGNRDLVPRTLDELGVERVFHKVRLRPGKPLWFGLGPGRADGTRPLVFGLPGNPVSGLVCFLLFVRPALEALGGPIPSPAALPRTVQVPLASAFAHRGERATYFPGRWRIGPEMVTVEPLEWAGSADLRAIAQADGFLAFPAGDRDHAPGDLVSFLPLD